MDPVPSNVVNASLYRGIRNRMREEHKRKGQRWGAYSSGRLVSEYKKKGGKYRETSQRSGSKSRESGMLARWYKERWINVCDWPKRTPCGRNTFSNKNFPYCRPLHRVTAGTPKTVLEMTPQQRKSLCSRKRKNPKRTIVI